MNILLILTGGTIGSKTQNGSICIDKENSAHLLKLYQAKNKTNINFHVIEPLSILSENITYRGWNTLFKCLHEVDLSAYNGIIITHGSDTLSYTAAATALLFSHVNIPIVLTAANYPLENPKSNGLINFEVAVKFICECINGVFVSYCSKNVPAIYLATRLVESCPYTDEFSDFSGEPFAIYSENSFVFSSPGINPKIEKLNIIKKPLIQKLPKLNNNILLVRAYPNQSYEYFNLSKKPKAVLHYLYHSATACTQGKETSIVNFIKLCNSYNIPVYLASYKKQLNSYESMLSLEGLKYEKMYNISLESAYAKLCIAYNLQNENKSDFINKNIFFEHLL